MCVYIYIYIYIYMYVCMYICVPSIPILFCASLFAHGFVPGGPAISPIPFQPSATSGSGMDNRCTLEQWNHQHRKLSIRAYPSFKICRSSAACRDGHARARIAPSRTIS